MSNLSLPGAGTADRALPVLHRLYLGLSWLIVAGIVVQVFLAGLHVFLPSRWLGLHIQLGHAIGPLLVLAALGAWAIRLPRRVRWLSLVLVLLFGLQYQFRTIAWLAGVPALAGLHAVNALVLFLAAVTLSRWVWDGV